MFTVHKELGGKFFQFGQRAKLEDAIHLAEQRENLRPGVITDANGKIVWRDRDWRSQLVPVTELRQ